MLWLYCNNNNNNNNNNSSNNNNNNNNNNNKNNVTNFDSFWVENIPKEIKKFVKNKNIITNIFRIQAYDSIMCGYFCIGFIDFVLAGKKLTDDTNLFFPYDFKKNYNIILNYFKHGWN